MRNARTDPAASFVRWPGLLGIAGIVVAWIIGIGYPLLTAGKGEEPGIGIALMVVILTPIGFTVGLLIGLVIAGLRSRHRAGAAVVCMGFLGAAAAIALSLIIRNLLGRSPDLLYLLMDIFWYAPIGAAVGALIGAWWWRVRSRR